MDRAKIAKIFIACLFIALIAGLIKLKIIDGGRYRQLSRKNCIRLLAQTGCRGMILGRNGEPLADNQLTYNLMLMPQDAQDTDEALIEISRVSGRGVALLRRALRGNYLSPSLSVVLEKNIGLHKAIALEQIKLDTPGLIVQAEPLRHYPHPGLAAHAIGYVSEIDRWRLTKLADYGYKTKDLVGFGGIEEKYDYFLRQEEGGLSFEVDHRGGFVRALGFRRPSHGKDICLTLDLRLQQIAEEKLSGRKGAVVIMDPYSGEILALASSPAFDPAAFAQRDSFALGSFLNDPDAPFLNRAIGAAYPAGSVFKLIVAAAALDTKKIHPSTTFHCIGSVTVGRTEFACWGRHGDQDLIQALAHSCNVYFYKAGLLAGAQNIHDYALKFGLARPSNTGLPYEKAGLIPSPLWRKVYRLQNWYDGDTANFSIGQGEVLVTPLQVARMAAVFANGGYLVNPYIVQSVAGQEARFRKRPQPLGLKKGTIESVRQGMRQAVQLSDGTAALLAGLPIQCAGKTGTAQAPPGAAHGWFAGFFPWQKPKFVVCVFLERGVTGQAACLIAKRIMEEMLAEGLA
jgi:penicillin-binding protein 2